MTANQTKIKQTATTTTHLDILFSNCRKPKTEKILKEGGAKQRSRGTKTELIGASQPQKQ